MHIRGNGVIPTMVAQVVAKDFGIYTNVSTVELVRSLRNVIRRPASGGQQPIALSECFLSEQIMSI